MLTQVLLNVKYVLHFGKFIKEIIRKNKGIKRVRKNKPPILRRFKHFGGDDGI